VLAQRNGGLCAAMAGSHNYDIGVIHAYPLWQFGRCDLRQNSLPSRIKRRDGA
jgi:hypothetical protein